MPISSKTINLFLLIGVYWIYFWGDGSFSDSFFVTAVFKGFITVKIMQKKKIKI